VSFSTETQTYPIKKIFLLEFFRKSELKHLSNFRKKSNEILKVVASEIKKGVKFVNYEIHE